MEPPNQHRRRASQLANQDRPQDPVPVEVELKLKASCWWGRVLEIYPNLYTTAMAIVSWYFCSTAISLYNKWMFSGDKLGFSFPIIITGFHQLILTLLSILTLIFIPSLRLNPPYQKIPSTEVAEGQEDDEFQEERLDYQMPVLEYVKTILPCSISSALDIGLGNTAIRFIPLSIFTMVKTSSLIFVLFWGVLLKLEKLTSRIVIIVSVMTFGVILMMWGQTGTPPPPPPSDTSRDMVRMIVRLLQDHQFVTLGVVLVFGSACMSGLRWALTQILLKKNKRTKNPILTIVYLSPGMAIVLFVIGLIVEGFGEFIRSSIWDIKGPFLTIILILIPGVLAFLMTISEFILLQNASLLTLSIAGIFKELLTIFLSWLVFGDLLNFVNIIGLIITIMDIIWYNHYRFNENSSDEPFVDIEMDNMILEIPSSTVPTK